MKSKTLWALFLAVAVLLAIGAVAYADNLQADGDGLTPLENDPSVSFTNVAGSASQTVLMAIKHTGSNTNVFKDSSTVTISVESVSGAGLSAVMDATDSTITLPSGWGSSDNNTLSVDTALATISISPSANGNGTVTFVATGKNSSNDTITRNADVNVTWTVSSDTTPPSISGMPSNMTVEATGPSGAVATWTKPTASDAVGVTSFTSNYSPGDLFPFGTTTVTYTAKDAAGNIGHASFTVTVEDTTAPTAAADNIGPVEGNTTGGAIVSDLGGSATDIVDASPTLAYSVDGAAIDPSTYVFGLGETTVTLIATDASDNASDPVDFTVTVQDTLPPTFAHVPNDQIVEGNTLGGATVSWVTPTASDIVAGSVPVTCNQVSGSTFPLDDTTVTFTAADGNGNTGHASFVITVQDTTAPAITVPNNISVYATGAQGATVTFSFSASDIVDGVVTVISDWASGSTFPLGVTTVHLTATDAHLNVAHASFTVTVTYKWSGFFEPVDNSPKFNVVNAGRAIPVKFSLAGNQGLNIFASGYPRYVQIAEGASTSEELIPIEDTVVATTTYLSFNAGTNQYNYVWKTDKTMAGKCYQLQLNLIDGTAHWANFRFTK